MKRPEPTSTRPQRLLAAAAAVIAAVTAAAAAAQAVPAPPAGRAAETALALLDYNRELCDGIAGKVVAYWNGLQASPDAALEAVRRFVVDRELSNLASGRAASDIVEAILPRVREESGHETAGALERLQRLEIELCDTVAYPDASRGGFQDELRRILDRIEQERSELGRLLVVSDDALASALGPYLGRIQLAGVEAEGEYRDYLDSLKPPPELPSHQELMEAWHRRYAPAVRPAKQALARYLQGRRSNDVGLIRRSCREISAAVIPLLRQKQVFEAPVDGISRPLFRAFVELKQMAAECGAGRSREVESHYGEMQKQLALASRRLAEFSLRP